MGAVTVTGDMLAAKFEVIFPHLDERQRRLLMGAEARALGHGGIRMVARAAGVREATVSLGVDELDSGAGPLGRVRRPGGGRKRAADLDPGLLPALLALVEPQERGDPMSPLRWTTLSTRNLAAELARQGHKVSARTVGDLLRREGFSLQGNAKTVEGKQHADRDAQFSYIGEQAREYLAAGDPVVSVDAKKKELVGEFKNGGREWRPKGSPARVDAHDFPDRELGKAIPYGIYDLAANAGWVNVGTDHDTAAFAVESIRRWWNGDRPERLPAGQQAADHRGRGRLQRLPHPRVEDRARRPGRRDRAGNHGVPPSSGHFQVEQNRAPAVLPHHHELAWKAPGQPRSHREQHRRDHYPAGLDSARRTRPRQLPDRNRGQRCADGRDPAGPAPLPRRLELHPPAARRSALAWHRRRRARRACRRSPRSRHALSHPALTGMSRQQLRELIAELAGPQEAQREQTRRRGAVPSAAARPGRARVPSSPMPTGSWPPCSTCANFAPKQSWPNCSPSTAAGSPRPSSATRPLLEEHGHAITPATARFPAPADLVAFLAIENDDEPATQIKPAC